MDNIKAQNRAFKLSLSHNHLEEFSSLIPLCGYGKEIGKMDSGPLLYTYFLYFGYSHMLPRQHPTTVSSAGLKEVLILLQQK